MDFSNYPTLDDETSDKLPRETWTDVTLDGQVQVGQMKQSRLTHEGRQYSWQVHTDSSEVLIRVSHDSSGNSDSELTCSNAGSTSLLTQECQSFISG
jgi:hypothetical protein